MKIRRRMRLCGAFAASRFVIRRGCAAGGWLPLSLRWRKRRVATREARVPGAVPATSHVTWLPRFQFHVQSYVSHQHRRDVLAPRLQTMLRTILDRRSTSIHTATARTDSRLDVSTYISKSTLVTRTVPRLLHSEVRTMLRSAVTHFASHSARSETTRRFETHHARHSILDRQARTHARELTVLRRRERDVVTRSVERHHAQAIPPALAARRPELVWRRTAPPVPEAPHPRADAAMQGSPSRSFAARPEAPAELHAAAARQSLQASALDPALVDRLAEDVIRRVERRARIERERRGLA